MLNEISEAPLRRLSGGSAGDWLVVGWFTEDATYRPLAETLAASLDKFGTPYEFVAVERVKGGWEANTRQKPVQLLAAMDRHPNKPLLLLDVDFLATADVSQLVASVGSADVGMQFIARRRSNGSSRRIASSQAIVVKPTRAGRTFVEAWVRQSEHDFPGDNDEAFIGLAIGEVPGCAFANLVQSKVHSLLSHRSRGHVRMRGGLRGLAHIVFSGYHHARRMMARL